MLKIAAGIYLLGVLMGGLLGHELNQPNCPSEDSCTVDYYQGKWHISEDRP